MQVDHRCFDTGVSHEGLHGANVCAGFKQARRERVPQGVGRDPLPPKAGETVKDCHWSALNFLNEEPDDKLLDNAYASKYVQDHFYPIGQPSQCGDLIFVIGSNGEVIHSAVHIAGDVAFTKNGANCAQPWTFMRVDKLPKVYSSGAAKPKALYYRRNDS